MSLIHGITSDGYSRGEAAYVTGHALVVDPTGGPGIAQTPDTPFATLDATAANLLMGFRATVGAGDDVVASERLSTGTPNTVMAGPDGTITFNTSTAVTRVDFVGVKNNATDATGCIGLAGTAAEALLQMTTVTFSTAVNRVVLTSVVEGTGQVAVVNVEGYTYA
tara:strand:+ start:213 stop:707 length:495 start_codon:yes stop_codon:yes gene_type:complete